MQKAFLYHLAATPKEDPFAWWTLNPPWDSPEVCEVRHRREEVKMISSLGLPLFYTDSRNYSTDPANLYDNNSRPVDSLSGFELILRDDNISHPNLVEAVSRTGGVLLSSEDERTKVKNWFDYALPAFTKRKIGKITLADLVDNAWELKQESIKPYVLANKFFVKTLVKKFAGVVDLEKKVSELILNLFIHFSPETPLIISEPLEFVPASDFSKHPHQEYRCWIANSKLNSISRYLDEQAHQVPEEASSFALDFARAHKDIFPSLYVADIALDKKRGYVLVECNPLSSAGRYYQNDFRLFLKEFFPEADLGKLEDVRRQVQEEEKIHLVDEQEANVQHKKEAMERLMSLLPGLKFNS